MASCSGSSTDGKPMIILSAVFSALNIINNNNKEKKITVMSTTTTTTRVKCQQLWIRRAGIPQEELCWYDADTCHRVQQLHQLEAEVCWQLCVYPEADHLQQRL